MTKKDCLHSTSAKRKQTLVFYARNAAWKEMLFSHHLLGTSFILNFMHLFLARFIVRRSWDGRRQSQLEELISWNAENHCFGGLPSTPSNALCWAKDNLFVLAMPRVSRDSEKPGNLTGWRTSANDVLLMCILSKKVLMLGLNSGLSHTDRFVHSESALVSCK